MPLKPQNILEFSSTSATGRGKFNGRSINGAGRKGGVQRTSSGLNGAREIEGPRYCWFGAVAGLGKKANRAKLYRIQGGFGRCTSPIGKDEVRLPGDELGGYGVEGKMEEVETERDFHIAEAKRERDRNLIAYQTWQDEKKAMEEKWRGKKLEHQKIKDDLDTALMKALNETMEL